MLRYFRKTYCTLDLCSLGLFRIALGLTLLFDLYTRFTTSEAFLSNIGFFPNHYSLFNPPERYWSILHAFASNGEVRFFLLAVAIVYSMFLVGVGGFPVKLLTLICAVSINTRNLWVENGGHIVINLFLLWSLFVPLEKRLSWKEFRSNQKTLFRPDGRSVTSIACFGMLVSLAMIYTFNFFTKTGETWSSGTAIHYTLHLHGRVTALGIWIRENIPSHLQWFFSRGVWHVEGLIPLLLLFPFKTQLARTVSLVLEVILHTAIGLCLVLGPFSPAMISVALMLAPACFWNYLDRKTGSESSKEVCESAPRLAKPLVLVREVTAVLLIYITAIHSINKYQQFMGFPRTLPIPEWTNTVTDYLRIPQNWRMFSQDAPVLSRSIVWIGTKKNGQLVDLDSFEPRTEGAYEEYFSKAAGNNYARVEWDTRFPGISKGDYRGHAEKYLRYLYQHSEITRVRLIFLSRTTLPPGQPQTNEIKASVLLDLPLDEPRL